MDPRRALLLHVEWGADEALDARPHRHLDAPRPTRPAPQPHDRPIRLPPDKPTAAAETLPTTLDAFLAELAAFDGAGLAATATHLVAPEGALGGLCVLAEAPGADEDRSGQGFIGPEGRLLRQMLDSIGVGAGQALLAYLSPWRPPGGRPPNETEITACLGAVHRLLSLARPRLLLTLGTVTSRALLGPSARRGRWTELSWPGQTLSVPALPTANPAVLRKQPMQKAAAWAELRLLRRKMEELNIS